MINKVLSGVGSIPATFSVNRANSILLLKQSRILARSSLIPHSSESSNFFIFACSLEFESSLPLSSSISRSLRRSLYDMALLDETSPNRGRMKWLKRMMGQIMATTRATKYSNFCTCFEMSKVLTRYIQVPKYPIRYNPSPYHQSEKLAIVTDTSPFFSGLTVASHATR